MEPHGWIFTDIMLNERSQTQKSTYCYDSIYTSSRTGNTNLWWQKSGLWPSDIGGDWERSTREFSGLQNSSVSWECYGFHQRMRLWKVIQLHQVYAFLSYVNQTSVWLIEIHVWIPSWSVSLSWTLGRESVLLEAAHRRASHSLGRATHTQLRARPGEDVCPLPTSGSFMTAPEPFLRNAGLLVSGPGELWQASDLRGSLYWDTQWLALQPEIWGSNPDSRLPSEVCDLLNDFAFLRCSAPEKRGGFIFASSVPGTYMCSEWTKVQCWGRKSGLHTYKVKVLVICSPGDKSS